MNGFSVFFRFISVSFPFRFRRAALPCLTRRSKTIPPDANPEGPEKTVSQRGDQ